MRSLKDFLWLASLVFAIAVGILHFRKVELPKKFAPDAFALKLSPKLSQNLDEELDYYKELVKKSPFSGIEIAALANLHYQRAELAGQMTDYQEAERLADESLKRMPDHNIVAMLVQAEIYRSRNEYPRALEKLEKIAKQDPNNLGALLLKAKILANLGSSLEALENIESVLLKNARSLPAHSLKAQILHEQGLDTVALGEFKLCLQLEKEQENLLTLLDAQGRLLNFLSETGEKEAALKVVAETSKIAGNYHRWNQSRLAFYRNNGFKQDGEKLLGTLALNPTSMPLLLEALSWNPQNQSRLQLVQSRIFTYGVKNFRSEWVQSVLLRKEKNLYPQALSVVEEEMGARRSVQLSRMKAQILLETGQEDGALAILRGMNDNGLSLAQDDLLAAKLEAKKGYSEAYLALLESAYQKNSSLKELPEEILQVQKSLSAKNKENNWAR